MMKNKLLLATILTCFFISTNNIKASQTKDTSQESYEFLNLFGEVLERAKYSYVEEISDKKLIEAAINGMLTSLDPHSSYLDADSFTYMNEQTVGKFGGLGIEVTMENGLVKVVSPIDDTPAHKAGLQAGDYITNIDGVTVVGLNLSEAVAKLRGKIGTKVDLSIRRLNEKPIEVTLKREEIKIQSVKNEIKNDTVGYIRISSFTEDVDKDVTNAVKKIQKELKDKLSGLVIDVRNNPGGLLDQAVETSDLFLDKGEIVSTRSRNKNDTIKFIAKEGDIANGLPIVVLINEGSASASEILAGALQDHRRAIILGNKSFGKGSVQTVVPLHDFGAMRITTARYYTPSGRSIQAKGIEPDVWVKQAKVEEYKSYGLNLSEADLKNALVNDNKDSNEPETKEKTKEELADYQLIRALDLVKALSLYSKNSGVVVADE